MGIVIDLIALGIIVVLAIVGRIRGFIATLVSIVKWIAAVLVAAIFAGAVAGFVYDSFIRQGVEDKVAEYLPSDKTVADLNTIDEICAKFGFDIANYDKGTGFVETVRSSTESGEPLAAAISNNVIRPLYMTVIKPICYTVLFILVIIVGLLVEKLSKLANLVPIVGKLNKSLGLILGIIYGILAVCLLCALISCIIQISHNSIPWLNTHTFDNSAVKYLMGFTRYKI